MSFPNARSDYLDLLGIAPKALSRKAEVMKRLDRLHKVSRCLVLNLHRVIVATLGLLRWDASWVQSSFRESAKMATKVERTVQSRNRFATWRHRGASWVVQRQGWQIEPVAIGLFSVVYAARRIQMSPWAQGFLDAWGSDLGIRSSLAKCLRDAYSCLHWGITESPFIVDLPQGRFDLCLVSDAVLVLRQGWRSFIMHSHRSKRHISVDTDSIDSAPLHDFLSKTKASGRALARRNVVGAEPNMERLAQIPGSGVERDCSCSATRGTTMHLMWECPHTQHVRDKHGLQSQDLENLVPAVFFHAFVLNGWAPAPVPPRSVDWTLDSVEGWISGLLSEFRVFPPSLVDEKIFLVPTVALRILRILILGLPSVSWISEEGEHTFVRDLGRVETTVDAAELVAVYVAASAVERANFNNVSFLTDHSEILDPRPRCLRATCGVNSGQ